MNILTYNVPHKIWQNKRNEKDFVSDLLNPLSLDILLDEIDLFENATNVGTSHLTFPAVPELTINEREVYTVILSKAFKHGFITDTELDF
jgi:hypothetical protein